MASARAKIAAAAEPDDLSASVAELAKLPPLQYDRCREVEAKRLGVRVGTLDREVAKARGDNSETVPGQGRPLDLPEPQPWPEPVDGEALLVHLATTFAQYLALPAGAADAVALWVMHSYAFDASPITPRLAITSPEKRCGKTTLLEVIGALALKPLSAANVTAAAVFRTIEATRPTLLIDEADSFLPDNEELRGVLNSGHRRNGNVVRLVGDDHEPRQFSTFAPVAIAMIGNLPGTLEDRSIVIPMRRRRVDETVKRLRIDRMQEFGDLARRCARWAADHHASLGAADPAVPVSLHDRAADNWRPLLAIADVAGGAWPERARKAALSLTLAGTDAGDQSQGVMLLADLQTIYTERGTTRLPSAELCEALAKLEHRPWPEWKAGKPITPSQLARLLKPFEIFPGTIRTPDGETSVGGKPTAKGYYLSAFEDAFARYLSGGGEIDPSQRHNPQKSSGDGTFQTVTSNSDVTDEKPSKPREFVTCNGVTAREVGTEEESAIWRL